MSFPNHDDPNTPDYNPWDLNAYGANQKEKLISHGLSKINQTNKIKGILMLGTAILLICGMIAVTIWGLFFRGPESARTSFSFDLHERQVNAEYEKIRAERAKGVARARAEAEAEMERQALIEKEKKRLAEQERQERELEEEIDQLAEQAADDAIHTPYIPEDGKIMYIITDSPITWDLENSKKTAKGISAFEEKASPLISEKMEQCLLENYKKTFPKETAFPISISFANGKAPALQPIQAKYLEPDELKDVQKCLNKSVSKLKNPFGKQKLSANIKLTIISIP